MTDYEEKYLSSIAPKHAKVRGHSCSVHALPDDSTGGNLEKKDKGQRLKEFLYPLTFGLYPFPFTHYPTIAKTERFL